jgi:hypothetical protein
MATKKTAKRKAVKRKTSKAKSVTQSLADLRADFNLGIARIVERLDAIQGTTTPDDTEEVKP